MFKAQKSAPVTAAPQHTVESDLRGSNARSNPRFSSAVGRLVEWFNSNCAVSGIKDDESMYKLEMVFGLSNAEQGIDGVKSVIFDSVGMEMRRAMGTEQVYENREQNIEYAAALCIANPNFAKSVLTRITIEKFKGRTGDPEIENYKRARLTVYEEMDRLAAELNAVATQPTGFQTGQKTGNAFLRMKLF